MVAINKHSSNLKDWSVKIPNAAYSNSSKVTLQYRLKCFRITNLKHLQLPKLQSWGGVLAIVVGVYWIVSNLN